MHLRDEINASSLVLVMAIVLDTIVLAAFIYMKIKTDLFVVFAALLGMLLILAGSWWYQRSRSSGNGHA